MEKASAKKPRAIDLFAGAGGLGLGLELAGFQVVAANEFEPVFSKTYEANHPDTRVICGDILSRDVFRAITEGVGDIDLIAGGPPCQGFSTVGKKEESDPRNRLFYAFVDAVSRLRPKVVLFENVSGFKRMYSGRAYHKLVELLSAMGYQTQHAILNALDFGLPQSRLRTFVVGTRSREPFFFPEPTHGRTQGLFIGQTCLSMADALSDLPLVKAGELAQRYLCPPQNAFQARMRGKGDGVLTEHEGPWHGEKLLRMMSHVPEGGSIKDIPATLRPRSYFANTYARLLWDQPVPTMTRNFGTPSSSRCIHPHTDRGLTTREGARLQGFPDSYLFAGSRTQKNLQIGNAVPPPLAEAIGKAILTHLRMAESGGRPFGARNPKA